MANDVFGIVGTRQAGVFRVERVVAEGGFAVVYRAIHEGFRARVALKCLKVPDQMTEAQRTSFLDRFREEGALLFHLSSVVPAVVRPLHVDAITLPDGRLVPFLALEWLEGEGLDQIVDRRRHEGKPPHELRELMELLQPAAHALAVAHRLPTPQGPVVVIHRDLKPENIFVLQGQGGPSVKILDFGIARTKSLASLDAGRVTQTQALDAFTPGYAAPEQWAPKRYGQVGPWTDVFCLALSMVEALTGRPAISGDLTEMMGTTNDPVRRPTPRTEGASVSDEIEAAFARALAVDPRERTRSIEAFWGELETALGLPLSLPGAGPGARRSMRPEGTPSTRPEPASGRAPVAEAPPSSAGGVASPRTPPPSAPSSRSATPSGPASVRAPVSVKSPELRSVIAPEGVLSSGPTLRSPEGAISFELDDKSARPAPAPPRAPASSPRQPAPPPSFALAASPRAAHPGTLAAHDEGDVDRAVDLRRALLLPVQLMVAAVVVAIADWAYAHAADAALAVGPVRAGWLAAPLALVGLGLAARRLMSMM
jgi:serine/threonine-protein kinase